MIFDGGSCVFDAKGNLFDELNYFEEDQRNYEFTNGKIQAISKPISIQSSKHKYQFIEEALVLGIRQYFSKLGFKKAILGLSGGIDSALVTYLAAKALGKENVLG